MCGRFTQIQTRADYLDYLASELEVGNALEPVPIGRYNVAPGSRVLLLNQREGQLHFDAVNWGYGPDWWLNMGRRPVINARLESAATSRMFKPLWDHGRAIVAADGWFEWKKAPGDATVKQPYFIYPAARHPILFAAISRYRAEEGGSSDDADSGFVIVTTASNAGLLDIHERSPVVLSPMAARQWLDPDTSSERALALAQSQTLPAEDFTWHPVTKAVGNAHQNHAWLIDPIDTPRV